MMLNPEPFIRRLLLIYAFVGLWVMGTAAYILTTLN